jgi:hypothetical protein
MHCLKNQATTDREAHNSPLFQNNIASVEQLIAALKCHKGQVNSQTRGLMTPDTDSRDWKLSHTQLFENTILSRERVVIKDYFGRLSGKFRVLEPRWNRHDELYRELFEICCALGNYDIRTEGGPPCTPRWPMTLSVSDFWGDERTCEDSMEEEREREGLPARNHEIEAGPEHNESDQGPAPDENLEQPSDAN